MGAPSAFPFQSVQLASKQRPWLWWTLAALSNSSLVLDVIEPFLPLIPFSNMPASLHTALPKAVWDTRCWRHLKHHPITPGNGVHSTITVTG